MIVTEELIRGEGKTLILQLTDKDENPIALDDLLDLTVEVQVNKISQGIYRKEDPEDDFAIVAVDDDPEAGKLALLPIQTTNYNRGLLELVITMVHADDDYEDGRIEIERIGLYRVK